VAAWDYNKVTEFEDELAKVFMDMCSCACEEDECWPHFSLGEEP
jgi:hypothetical protein